MNLHIQKKNTKRKKIKYIDEGIIPKRKLLFFCTSGCVKENTKSRFAEKKSLCSYKIFPPYESKSGDAESTEKIG